MPNCRQCGSRLSKLDKDICPVCGLKHPFEDAISQDTVEFTQTIGVIKDDIPKAKSRKLAIRLACFTNILGLDFYYLHFNLAFYLNLAYVLILGIILPIILTIYFGLWYLFIIFLGLSILFHIGFSIYLKFAIDLKDGRGEFLR